MVALSRRGLGAGDKLVLAFCAAYGAVIVAHAGTSPAWPWHLAALALFAGLALLMGRAPDTPFTYFMGAAYPLLLAPAMYTSLGTLNMDRGVNHDLWAQHLDQVLFGGQVSVTWHQAWPNTALSAVLHVCYVLYYPIVVTVALYHWRMAKREAYERAAFIVALAFYVCYIGFALWPVNGPRYFWGAATGPAAAIAPARLVHAILAGGSSLGTAFPSSHICVCWCAVLATWACSRRLAIGLGIPAIGLALGTVYGQFHYGVDALAGAALAWVLLFAADPLFRRLQPRAAPGPKRRATEAFRVR